MEELGSLLVAEPVLLVAGQHGVRLECGELLKDGGREEREEEGGRGREMGRQQGGRKSRGEREGE